jgi:peptidase E
MEPESPLLDQYVLGAARREMPAVCFVSTASGDAEGFIERFYDAFGQFPCRPSHLSLFKPPAADLRSFVFAQDIIYVGGGSTRNLLALWREWGLDRILREAWESGIVLAGISAGMICWFEAGVTDSTPGTTGDPIDDYSALPCLGFLPGSACPHYDGEPSRRPAYQRLVAAGAIAHGLAAADGVALHFIGQDLADVVSSRPSARAFRVERVRGSVAETPIIPRFLGATDT